MALLINFFLLSLSNLSSCCSIELSCSGEAILEEIPYYKTSTNNTNPRHTRREVGIDVSFPGCFQLAFEIFVLEPVGGIELHDKFSGSCKTIELAIGKFPIRLVSTTLPSSLMC